MMTVVDRARRKWLGACLVTAATFSVLISGASAAGFTAYVADYDPDSSTAAVVPIDLATNAPGTAIPFGANPFAIAIAPDGSTAYVLANDNTVTPIDLATNTSENSIPVGSLGNNESTAIAITPDGSTAYVTNEIVNYGSNTLTPVDLATKTPEAAIPFDGYPTTIAIAPDGKTAYVGGSPINGNGSGTVTPIDLATNTAAAPIMVGSSAPQSIAITPDGSTAYVTDSGDGTVVPIDLATDTPQTGIPDGGGSVAIAITPDGSTAYVANYDGSVLPIDLATSSPGTEISISGATEPDAIAITPDGLSAYVASRGASDPWQMTFGSGSVTPIDLATSTAGTPITVGSQLPAIAIPPAVFGAPTATITSPAGGETYTVGQTVTTSFSCTDASDGPGISSCKDSNAAAGGSGTLDTATAGTRTYTVKGTSKDGRTVTARIAYTVTAATTTATTTTSTTSTAPATTTSTTPATTTSTTSTTPKTPPVDLRITGISVSSPTVVWCSGYHCRYPSTGLQFTLNLTTTPRLVLRRRLHGEWRQVAAIRIDGHAGINRHRIAGRWHGQLVPDGAVQLAVQIRRDDGRWQTAKTIALTVRHTRSRR
jgi:DNA-binding beta-propeller fold protein YncE